MTTVSVRKTFLVVCCLHLISCREKLLVDTTNASAPALLRFSPGDYFSYDNWKLDIFRQRIPGSYFRNSWTVADTGRAIRGWTRVAIVIDSTFDVTNRLVRRDSLLFRIGDEGDVYQWGFLKALIAERETLNLAPQWDRLAAFSQPFGTSWAIARIDTTIGAHTNATVYGNISTTKEYVGPLIINGEEHAILSYRIAITKPRLAYTFWLTDSPTSIAKALDDSEALTNSTLRELKILRTRQ